MDCYYEMKGVWEHPEDSPSPHEHRLFLVFKKLFHSNEQMEGVVSRSDFLKTLTEGHYNFPVVVCCSENSAVTTQQAISSFKGNQSAMNQLVSLVTVPGPLETLPHRHGG